MTSRRYYNNDGMIFIGRRLSDTKTSAEVLRCLEMCLKNQGRNHHGNS